MNINRDLEVDPERYLVMLQSNNGTSTILCGSRDRISLMVANLLGLWQPWLVSFLASFVG